MSFKSLFGKLKQNEEDYVTLGKGEDEVVQDKMLVHIERMADYADADRIQQRMRDGHIMLVKIRDLRQKDINELKKAVTKIRKTCLALDGDIAGLGDDWIIVTPATGRIHRKQVEE